MQVNGEWLEVRSTAPGVLDPLGYRLPQPADDAKQWPRQFSFVIDGSDSRTRALPMLHHGRANVFADRRVENLGARVNRALEALATRDEVATFQATACRLGDAYGLYARDLFNRSSFRIYMRRLGVEFSDDPYIELTSTGRLKCNDWGEFDPEFVVGGGPYPKEEEEVEERRGGLTPFMLGVLKFGPMKPDELALLTRIIRAAPVLVSRSPSSIVDTLKAA